MADDKQRALAVNTVAGAQATHVNAKLPPPPPPEGLLLNTQAEHTLWRQLTQSRGRQDYTSWDLVQLHTLMTLTLQHRKCQAELAKEPSLVVANSRGSLVQHPLIGIIGSLHNQIVQLTRVLSLSSGIDATAARNRGKAENVARDAVSDVTPKKGKGCKKNNVSLLAI